MGASSFPAERCGLTGYMTAFIGRIYGDVFKEVDGLDEELIQNEVEGRFLWLLRQAWREEVR